MYIEYLKFLYEVYIIWYDFRIKNLNLNKLNVDLNSLFIIFIIMVFIIVYMYWLCIKIVYFFYKFNGK